MESISVPSVALEEPLPDDERLSSEVDMLSQQISRKIFTTETKEMPTETERLPSETGIPFQRVKSSLAITEEISAIDGDLDEEGKTAENSIKRRTKEVLCKLSVRYKLFFPFGSRRTVNRFSQRIKR